MARIPTFPLCLDDVKQVSITSLRQWGYLKSRFGESGVISWSRGDQQTGSISVYVSIPDEYMKFDYSFNGKPLSYRVQLQSLPSNLGKGCVWYFICPETSRRCRKLYQIGEKFLSRFAYPDSMYRKQVESKRWRDLSLAISALRDSERKNEFLRKRYSKPFYKDKPTRKYQAMLDREQRALKHFAEKDPSLGLDSYFEQK